MVVLLILISQGDIKQQSRPDRDTLRTERPVTYDSNTRLWTRNSKRESTWNISALNDSRDNIIELNISFHNFDLTNNSDNFHLSVKLLKRSGGLLTDWYTGGQYRTISPLNWLERRGWRGSLLLLLPPHLSLDTLDFWERILDEM